MGRKFLQRLTTSLSGFMSASTRVAISWRGSLQRSGLFGELSGVREEISGYRQGYGGLSAFLRSPVLWCAVILAFLLTPLWDDRTWPQVTFDIVPGLLGFSLGAMAIVLAFPSRTILRIISEGGRPDSYYMELASKFLHFIFAQVVSLLLAAFGKAYNLFIVNIFGGIALVYVILTGAATALALFGLAQIYNHPTSSSADEEVGDGE
jgi:hypothetical protein